MKPGKYTLHGLSKLAAIDVRHYFDVRKAVIVVIKPNKHGENRAYFYQLGKRCWDCSPEYFEKHFKSKRVK